jgi:glucose-1-phosphate cytidylyltransferase
MTGGRLKRIKEFIGNEPFMFTYGDGLSNINPLFVQQHGEQFNKCVVTAVHPTPRFGKLQISPDGDVVSFSEKTIGAGEWINAGFMYLLPFVLDFIPGDACNLETDVMPKLCWDSNLLAFKYEGLFTPIDTLRDLRLAEELASKGEFRWIK